MDLNFFSIIYTSDSYIPKLQNLHINFAPPKKRRQKRKAIIMVTCPNGGRSNGELVVIDEDSDSHDCYYMLELHTNELCSISGWGKFGIFIFIIFVILVFYFIIGVLFNRCNGAQGNNTNDLYDICYICRHM